MKNEKPDYEIYKRLHRVTETIVRNSGDERLDIFGFIKKMRLEMENGNLSPEKCAEINEVPVQLLEILKEIPLEDVERFQQRLKKEISAQKENTEEKNGGKRIEMDINPILGQIIFKNDDFKTFLTTESFLFSPYEKKNIKSMTWEEFEKKAASDKRLLEDFIKTTDRINGSDFYLKARLKTINSKKDFYTVLLNDFKDVCERISKKERFPQTRVLLANGLNLKKGAYLSFRPGEYKYVKETGSIVPVGKRTEYMLRGETIIKKILETISGAPLPPEELKRWKILISKGKDGVITIEPSDYIWAVKPGVMKLRKSDMNGLPLGFRSKERMPERKLELIFEEKEPEKKENRKKPDRDFGPGL